MSATVDRLKELLFDQEAHELHELRRIAAAESRAREDMQATLEALVARTGSKESLETSVAEVIDGALRKAETDRHQELAAAVAPLVVRTVRTEIRNSKDELVAALYPMTGRMVKAYIASAMKDLANDINRRLEANPLMLRLRSLATGRSMGELAMADTQRLHVEELYLIRRGTGELLGRWPEATETQGRDHVMSGILTAINEFSTEALGDEGSALRQIDLGERQLYLRASPNYLLAARCGGVATQPVESVLDEAFLGALERIHALPSDAAGQLERAKLLPSLSDDLSVQIAERQEAEAGPRFNPLKAIGMVLVLLVCGWLGWSTYQSYQVERTRQIATGVISSLPALDGYPVRLSVGWLGRKVDLAGLAPSRDVKDTVAERLIAALPGVEIDEALTVLPNALGEIEPKIAGVKKSLDEIEPEIRRVKSNITGLDPKIAGVREDLADEVAKVRRDVQSIETSLVSSTLAASLERAERKLARAAGEIKQLTAVAEGSQPVVTQAETALQAARAAVRTARADLAANSSANAAGALAGAAAGLRASAEAVAALVPKGAAAATSGTTAKADAPNSTLAAADRLGDDLDGLTLAAATSAQVLALKKSLQPRDPSPREKLEAFARRSAVFFGSDTDLRDPVRSEAMLKSLADLMQGNDLLVRVVGYTDVKGTSDKNTPLSRQRAETVVAKLVELGAPADRLVAIGRIDLIGISPDAGEASPNRRVEFEVGFDGESGR